MNINKHDDLTFYQGELGKKVKFDITKWQEVYEQETTGTFFIFYSQPNGDLVIYDTLDTLGIKNNNLIWSLSENDTEFIGVGYLQIKYENGDKIAKSQIMRVKILEPPPPKN